MGIARRTAGPAMTKEAEGSAAAAGDVIDRFPATLRRSATRPRR
jgi:hypothetical protein